MKKVRGNSKPKDVKASRELQQLDDRELQALISRRAYELYQERGCEDGHECEDWLRAERELLSELENLVTGPMRTSLPAAHTPVETKTT